MDFAEIGIWSAAAAADEFFGATAPNPPVGACLMKGSCVLAVGAHERAGLEHAEVQTIRRALELHGERAVADATLSVTLEPCNHHGRTPPCTEAILRAGIRRVVIGAYDPNKSVQGNGAEYLRSRGVEVLFSPSSLCNALLRPFEKRCKTGLPWVLHKIALRDHRNTPTMLPVPGKNTFTSPESLTTAHLLRRRSDAFLTTARTVLADDPYFTVRHVPDHPGKKRHIAVLLRRPLEPGDQNRYQNWKLRQSNLGFNVHEHRDFDQALLDLSSKGCLQVLVEAGPTLSQWISNTKKWDERVVFFSNPEGKDRCLQELSQT